MFDLQAKQREMNALRQVPVSIARVLASSGQKIMAETDDRAAGLPGGTARQKVTDALRAHAASLASFAGDPSVMYANGADLKERVIQAFVEANAAQEGSAAIGRAWSAMWGEIATEIAKLPVSVAKKVNETAGALLGIPGWLLGVGAVGIFGLMGYVYANAKGRAR